MKQLNHKPVTGNAMITQADEGKTVVIINSDEYSKILHAFPAANDFLYAFQKSYRQISKIHTENTATMQLNHRQRKDKIPNPKETFTTNIKSMTNYINLTS